MLGQPASSHTVCSPSRRTRDFSSVNSGPIRARVRIHSGFFSIGVAELRASRRSNRRPSGAGLGTVSYTHLRAHETPEHLVCRLLLEKKKKRNRSIIHT